MGMTFEDACKLITKAKHPEDLFGPAGSDYLNEARRQYRLLGRIVYPDVAPGDKTEEAHLVMSRLNVLWDQYTKGLSGGFEITTKKRTYNVENVLFKDEFSNLYPCSWTDGDEQYGMMRLPRLPRDNDLMQNEVKAFKKLDLGIPRFRPYAPQMVETFRFRDAATKTDRQAIVTPRLEGFSSLFDVHDAYPDGIDGRDAAWMWRRMLAGIGWAHQAGMVHGAVLPHNVLIHPLQHGVVFINWAYSVSEEGTPLTALTKGFESWYPSEVKAKKPVSVQTDITMIAACMLFLLGNHAPVQFKAFARGCATGKPEWGTDRAWEIQRDFDDLLTRLYGKRKYRPFSMPETA